MSTTTQSLVIGLSLLVMTTSADAEPNSQVRSVYEPGSLGWGNFGARVGFAVADGPPGPGAELFLGLGRIDVSVGASAMPVTVFGETDTSAYLSLAGQGLLYSWGATRLSARLMVADEVSDPSRGHAISEVRLTTGSTKRRFLVGGGTAIEHMPSGDWDAAVVGHAGVEVLSEGAVGVTLLAVVIAGADEVTPLASLNLTFL